MTSRMQQWTGAVKGFTARGTRWAVVLTAATMLGQGFSAARADEFACLRSEPAAVSKPALFGKAVEDKALAELRGGTRLSIDSATGVVQGNSATGTASGGNIIGSGAFANASGLPVVIQNSGNNVLIQSSTTVNVQIR
jgi:hypothetical protein